MNVILLLFHQSFFQELWLLNQTRQEGPLSLFKKISFFKLDFQSAVINFLATAECYGVISGKRVGIFRLVYT